ncbi:hypothetical protein VHUM_02350 [Vanrija humicola]|uniref:Uncharacterized protein n=1 Tax=Vanrija humicola TaxID=5417 RepID=A0A7D8V2H6_VANHU|nr:hypothetical protein VHUM_02350 [Vanrija humicola]
MSQSSDTPHTHLPPDAAPAYLHRLVGATLQRRGFEGCEAGALAEMERLIEHHSQRARPSRCARSQRMGRARPVPRGEETAYRWVSLLCSLPPAHAQASNSW